MNEFLTTRQVANILGVHYNTVYRYIRSGVLKAYQWGSDSNGYKKHWRIKREDLEEFIGEVSSEHEESSSD